MLSAGLLFGGVVGSNIGEQNAINNLDKKITDNTTQSQNAQELKTSIDALNDLIYKYNIDFSQTVISQMEDKYSSEYKEIKWKKTKNK